MEKAFKRTVVLTILHTHTGTHSVLLTHTHTPDNLWPSPFFSLWTLFSTIKEKIIFTPCEHFHYLWRQISLGQVSILLYFHSCDDSTVQTGFHDNPPGYLFNSFNHLFHNDNCTLGKRTFMQMSHLRVSMRDYLMNMYLITLCSDSHFFNISYKGNQD